MSDSLQQRIESLYRATKECRNEASEAGVHAVDRALELASMHLHHALWTLGADIGLNPDFDDASDEMRGEGGGGGN